MKCDCQETPKADFKPAFGAQPRCF